MSRQVYCQKLKKEATGLNSPPYPGSLGQRVYEGISQEAWKMWQSHQTILINEYRLSLADKEARDFLATEMEKFLFGCGSDLPHAFVDPNKAAE